MLLLRFRLRDASKKVIKVDHVLDLWIGGGCCLLFHFCLGCNLLSWDILILIVSIVKIRSVLSTIEQCAPILEVSLNGNGLKYADALLIPLLVKELEIFASPLLDLNIHMICELLDELSCLL